MNTEANRCLQCRNAMCQKACPVHTDIPQAMALYKEGKLEEAGAMLFENNPMSAITCRICDWKQFCYGHCVLNAKEQPIQWYRIEQEISETYLKHVHLEKEKENGKRIAVVGAGPAGICASLWLAKQGYAVTLYDNHERIGGVLRYGIPSFRLEKDILENYERLLNELGVVFHANRWIRDLETLEMNFDAVLIASGAIKSRKLRIPGEDRPNVRYAIEYLEEADKIELGENVIVIGGGNVAMDAVRTAKRNGSNASVYYRKTFENMPANPLEVEEAKSEGILFHVFEAPVEVKEHSVIFRKCENIKDERGKTVTKILDDTDHEVACDTLIVAAGESIDLSVFGDRLPVMNRWNYPETDEQGHTSFAKIWIAGDFILGASTVVQAVESAKKACIGIMEAVR